MHMLNEHNVKIILLLKNEITLNTTKNKTTKLQMENEILISSIKTEPLEIGDTLETSDDTRCRSGIELEILKKEADHLIQLILRRKTAEIKALYDENKRLADNEKNILNQINILTNKINRYEDNQAIKQNDDSINKVNLY